MNDSFSSIESLEEAGYRLELLGESLAVEGREVRQAAQRLKSRAATANEQGQHFESGVAIEAAAQKMHGTVEAGVRHQIDTVREAVRSLLR